MKHRHSPLKTAFLTLLTAACLLSACDNSTQEKANIAAIADIPETAVDPLSHMTALETAGHKGQIHFHDGSEMQWFGSIANLIMYMRLPETANRPMTAYASTSDAQGNPLNPWQWVAVEEAWFVLLPPKKDDPFALATWTAYADKNLAEQVVSSIPLSRLYRYQDIQAEDLIDCH